MGAVGEGVHKLPKVFLSKRALGTNMHPASNFWHIVLETRRQKRSPGFRKAGEPLAARSTKCS